MFQSSWDYRQACATKPVFCFVCVCVSVCCCCRPSFGKILKTNNYLGMGNNSVDFSSVGKINSKRCNVLWSVVVSAFNPSTREAEVGRSLRNGDQFGLHSEILSQKQFFYTHIGNVACLARTKPWVQSPALHKPGVVAHTYNPGTRWVTAGRSGQSHLWL